VRTLQHLDLLSELLPRNPERQYHDYAWVRSKVMSPRIIKTEGAQKLSTAQVKAAQRNPLGASRRSGAASRCWQI
jgi:hypothetical protein